MNIAVDVSDLGSTSLFDQGGKSLKVFALLLQGHSGEGEGSLSSLFAFEW